MSRRRGNLAVDVRILPPPCSWSAQRTLRSRQRPLHPGHHLNPGLAIGNRSHRTGPGAFGRLRKAGRPSRRIGRGFKETSATRPATNDCAQSRGNVQHANATVFRSPTRLLDSPRVPAMLNPPANRSGVFVSESRMQPPRRRNLATWEVSVTGVKTPYGAESPGKVAWLALPRASDLGGGSAGFGGQFVANGDQLCEGGLGGGVGFEQPAVG
jgi:hypothetical protein